jgi:HSP20 family protein
MLDDMHSGNYFQSHAPRSWTPSVNLYETEERYVVCVELAGMRREQIDVRTDDGILHIQGFRRKPVLPERADADSPPSTPSVHLMEIDSGRFHRRIPLAPDVVAQQISAVYRQGYLWVILPRATDAEPSSAS